MLVALWLLDTELGTAVAKQPWIIGRKQDDDGDRSRTGDRRILEDLHGIASTDIEMAKLSVDAPWFVDRETYDEHMVLHWLRALAYMDIELARQISGLSWFEDNGILSNYVLRSLISLASSETDVLSKLTSQPWFSDGLDEEGAALVVTLGWVAGLSPDLYTDLLRTHYTQSRTVSLKLAGEVNIWIVQNTPFPSNDVVLTEIEDTARIGEELLGVPFPTTDVILLLVDRSQVRYRVYGGYFDTHMRLTRENDGYVASVPHETAHYWFNNLETGPRWLTEGAAEFIETYVKHRREGVELSRLRAKNALNFSTCVDDWYENIRHLIDVMDNGWEIARNTSCVYHMGEYFLHSASRIAGEEAIMSALGELHLSELGRKYNTVEDHIYEVFLKHVPSDRQKVFRDFYQEVHGGAAAFGETDFSDDHSDEAELATSIAVGESIAGTLNYMFDFDYFRFRPQEGQKYRINVNHDTLRATSVGLYAPDGETGLNRYWIKRDLVSTGPRIVWIAPSSDDYYVAVHNFGGKTGRYTITIDAAHDAVDDHGDTPAAATGLSLGEIVQGTIDDDLDIDYFRLPVERDQRYWLSAISVTLEEFQFSARMPDGGIWTADTGDIRTCCPHGFQFITKGPGNASIGITGLGESVGTYTFKVILLDNRHSEG